MAHETDVFICYRRYGAQTAKLFKRYLIAHNFPGKVWYSDSEINGNYRLDPADLISEAGCAVMFIDPDFTKDFFPLKTCSNASQPEKYWKSLKESKMIISSALLLFSWIERLVSDRMK